MGNDSNNRSEAIRRVVAAFERSEWSEIDVRAGDVRVHLIAARHGDGPARRIEAPSPGPEADDNVAAPREPPAGDAAPRARSHDPEFPAGAHVVVAPSPGVFWRAPEPGAPPFVDTGDIVEASTTVCIIEVMKLMSHLKAGVAGEVAVVFGENGAAVSAGEPLFAISPHGSER